MRKSLCLNIRTQASWCVADGHEARSLTWRKGRSRALASGTGDVRGTHGAACGESRTGCRERLGDAEEGLMRELAAEQGKLNHTYDTMETSGWHRCSEGHGLRHAGGLRVAEWPYVAQDKGDD